MKVTINPGPCKLVTIVEAENLDDEIASIKITSECKFYKPLEEELTQVDFMKELFSKPGTSEIYTTAMKYCKHPTCPVPVGILKALEAACGMALPTDVSIIFEK